MESNDFSHVVYVFELVQPGRLVIVLVGIIAIGSVVRFIEKISRRAQAKFPGHRLFVLQLSTMLNFAFYVLGCTLLVYVVLRPPKEIVVAIAGSAAVAIGFSLKDIVASVFAGIVLLFDRPFQVGDRVRFSGIYGEIVRIGLRTVKLITLDDDIVTIPNSRFLTETVSSGNAGALNMTVTCNFHIALNADLSTAKDICYSVAATSRYIYLKKPVDVFISEVSIAERLVIQLRVKANILDCRYEKDFETDVVARVCQLFLKHQIARPT